jgi:hypothetical protein
VPQDLPVSLDISTLRQHLAGLRVEPESSYILGDARIHAPPRPHLVGADYIGKWANRRFCWLTF